MEPKSEPRKSILIAGYLGYDLVGDEAILEPMLHDLRKLAPDTSFIVTSQSPEKTRSAYGVEAIPICDLNVILNVLEKCDLIVVGGGGVFNEYTPWRPEGLLTLHPDFNVFCASLPVIAAAYGKPCMIYGVGVEPLYTPFAKEHVANAFAMATVATVRDQGSLDILQSIGAPIEKVKVTADPAFRLPNASSSAIELLTRCGITVTEPIWGVQLRHWNIDHWDLSVDPNLWEAEVANALDTLMELTGGTLIFIPFQQLSTWAFSDYTQVLTRVKEMMRHGSRVKLLDAHLRPSEVSTVFAGCDLILAMRFHSVVLSVKNATPCVAISYSLKVKTAMERSGLGEFALGLDSLTADRLTNALLKCYENRDRIRNNLKAVSKEMQHLAFKNAELALQLMGDQHSKLPYNARFLEIAPSLFARQTKLLVEKEHTLEVLFNDITSYLRHLIDKKYEIGEGLLRILLAINGNEPEWNYLFAFCLHMQKKDLDKVLWYYNRALGLGFYEFWVRYNRGSLHMELGNLEEARADLERAVELNPEHLGASKRLQELMQRISMPQLAVQQQEPVDLKTQLAEKEASIASLNQQLTSVYNSKRWRLASRLAKVYWKIRWLSSFIRFKRGR